MHASLPMYDRPEMRTETDRLWALIRDALRDRGLAAPETLTRSVTPLWDLWESPDLLMSQTCGLPVRKRLHDKVQLITTPDVGLPGCPPGHYNSVLITRTEHAQTPIETLLRGRIVINEDVSQSGWGALYHFATGLGVTPARPVQSGAHSLSARMVLDGQADLSAIDAHTWRLLLRYEPDMADLVERGRTRPTPSLPLITAGDRDPEPIARALDDALKALSASDRETLGLTGFTRIPLPDYMALPIPAKPDDLPH